MKLNKSKNKGKVHPSPSSASSCSNNEQILNHLLPTAILTLISVLSLQDREALAYLITHSLNSSSSSSSSSSLPESSSFDPKTNNHHKKNKSNKKFTSTTTTSSHKSPCFDCCCFDCFSSFWNRWNSSPHRELIDHAIEAFEEHLASSEKNKKNKNNSRNSSTSSSKRGEKTGCSTADAEEREPSGFPLEVVVVLGGDVEERETRSSETLVSDDLERENEKPSSFTGTEEAEEEEEEEERESGPQNEKKKLQQQQQQQQHKGLARKVLPDVIGLFNSRLWNLWGPNV